MRITPLLVAAWLLVGLTTAAEAQRVSDPSVRAREDAQQRVDQLDREGRIGQEGDPVIADELQRRPLPAAGGPTVLLRDVRFDPPSAFLTQADIARITGPYVGQRLDFRGISQLVQDVNDFYTENGIVTAAAILPPQDLGSGNLRIQLVEGELGNVRIVGERETETDFVLERIRLTRSGNIVDVPQIAEDLTFFNQTSRANVRMLLEPGAGFGLTDLTFGITEPPRDQLEFFLDNEGVTSTGEIQGSVLWRRYGLAGRDDTLLTFFEASEGSRAAVVSYDIPISTRNTRLIFGVNASNIEIVDGPAEPLDVSGASYALTATVKHPFVANAEWLVQGVALGTYEASETDAAGIPLVDTTTNRLGLGVEATYGGTAFIGFGRLDAVQASVDNNLFNTSRDVLLAIGSFDGTYFFENDYRLRGFGSFQWTDEDLIPGNLLYQVGGPTTVRGYPSDGVAGDTGYHLSLEVRRVVPVQERLMDVFGFADYGKVFSVFPAEVELGSVGLGASYPFNDRTSLDLTAAFPVIDSVADQDDFAIYARIRVAAF